MVQGFEQKYEAAPDQREKKLRPEKGKEQEDQADEDKRSIPVAAAG